MESDSLSLTPLLDLELPPRKSKPFLAMLLALTLHLLVAGIIIHQPPPKALGMGLDLWLGSLELAGSPGIDPATMLEAMPTTPEADAPPEAMSEADAPAKPISQVDASKQPAPSKQVESTPETKPELQPETPETKPELQPETPETKPELQPETPETKPELQPETEIKSTASNPNIAAKPRTSKPLFTPTPPAERDNVSNSAPNSSPAASATSAAKNSATPLKGTVKAQGIPSSKDNPNHIPNPQGSRGNPLLFGGEHGPSFIYQVMPEYPMQARRQKISGQVRLQILINSKGKVEEVQVESSSAEVLTKAAIAAVSKSTFKPLSLNGVNVSCWTVLPISFQLN